MRIIEQKVELNNYQSRLMREYLGSHSLAVFDLETTGLSASRDEIILAGILILPSGFCSTSQPTVSGKTILIFAENLSEEPELISRTLDILSGCDIFMTYNGRSFDIPFLQKRAEHYDMTCRLTGFGFDLYVLIRDYTDLKERIASLSQKNMEEFLGIASCRRDQISGKESVDLYRMYLRSRSPDLEEKILLHNHDDILQLYRLLPLIEKTDFHRAMYRSGFPAGRFVIREIALRDQSLVITAAARFPEASNDYISFPSEERPCYISYSASSGICQVQIPMEIIQDSPGLTQTNNLTRMNDPSQTNCLAQMNDPSQTNCLAQMNDPSQTNCLAQSNSLAQTNGLAKTNFREKTNERASMNDWMKSGQAPGQAGKNMSDARVEIVDISDFLSQENMIFMEQFPAVTAGFLVVRRSGMISYLEINMFTRRLMESLDFILDLPAD